MTHNSVPCPIRSVPGLFSCNTSPGVGSAKAVKTVNQLSVMVVVSLLVVELLNTLHLQSEEGDTAKPWHRIHHTLHYIYDTKRK